MKTDPVVVLGLDALDPGMAWRLARGGQLPALADLFRSSARCRVRNPFGLFVGALWVSFATGLRPDRHGFHCWDEIEVETYRRRLNTPSVKQKNFWTSLSDAGRRVAAIDVPHAKADGAINGVQLVEWGCHDRHFGLHGWPPGRAADIASAFGIHPVLGVDPYAVRDFAADDYVHRDGAFRTCDEERALLRGLREGAAAKRGLLAALFAEEDWDLFLAVYGESHAIGHQQWHLHDPSHPRFDPAVRDAVGGDPLVQVYRDIDASVGDLVAAAGPDATILVLMSHGMGPHYDGAHLLDEVLTRLDRFERGPQPPSGARDLAGRAIRSLAPSLRGLATAFAVPLPLRHALSRAADSHGFAEARARQHYFLEPNNYVYGGIRLNVVGREPRGCVLPDEIGEVCKRLEEDLLALVNVDTGRPAIRAIIRSDDHHRRSPTDAMPDLFVDWDRSGPIETMWSPKTGTVHAPYEHWRTGDHREAGLLLARGPGLPANTRLPALDVEDLGPSIAARMGVALADVDGIAAPWLAGAGGEMVPGVGLEPTTYRLQGGCSTS